MKLELEFLKRVLTDSVGNEEIRNEFFRSHKFPAESIIKEVLANQVDEQRLEGLDWPERAHTMIGLKRLNNLHDCLDYIRENKIKGDFIETGVWRGGASIFIKYYNEAYKLNRKVFVADSFEGLPVPDAEKYPHDLDDVHYKCDFLKVSLEEVKQNFEMYNVLDENVIFLKGWFSETLKDNDQINDLSLLRFDGDMYGSMIDVLSNLYPKLRKKGVIVIDDYCLENCVQAVKDFRSNNNINDGIEVIDHCGVFWYKG
jgi:O-methyltransferase